MFGTRRLASEAAQSLADHVAIDLDEEYNMEPRSILDDNVQELTVAINKLDDDIQRLAKKLEKYTEEARQAKISYDALYKARATMLIDLNDSGDVDALRDNENPYEGPLMVHMDIQADGSVKTTAQIKNAEISAEHEFIKKSVK